MMALAANGYRKVRDWWLIAFCVILFAISVFPSMTEGIYPIIDTVGSNMTNMNVDKHEYVCGNVVQAYFLFQKQRNTTGQIHWKLVPNAPNAQAHLYPHRVVSSPRGIAAHWAPVETLPADCRPGRYHFEGSLTYPLVFGSVTYPLRTECFEVNHGK